MLRQRAKVSDAARAKSCTGLRVNSVVAFRRRVGTLSFSKRNEPMTARIPKNEKQRLKVLWQYSVLDTMPEEIFDDLTELAARICEAPVAMITLVDEDRQWFKAKVGVSLKETSRDISFCAHAIMQPGLFIVPDATRDQ